MGRIYEALQKVESEQSGHPNVIDFPETIDDPYGDQIRAKMRELYRLICKNCPDHSGKIVQLVGPQHSVGTSRLLRTLATACAESMQKTVLIIDTDTTSPQFTHFSIKPLQTWTDALRRKSSPDSVLYSSSHSGLRLMKAFRETQSAATLLESPLLQEHLSELREAFDLILLDSSAAGVQQDGVELSTIVDGTILVVEAEKTRWQVAQAAREEIEARGGNVLGVLLNGLQFHIPAALYNRL